MKTKYIKRSKRKNHYHFISGLLCISDGLIGVLSLGFYYGSFHFQYVRSRY